MAFLMNQNTVNAWPIPKAQEILSYVLYRKDKKRKRVDHNISARSLCTNIQRIWTTIAKKTGRENSLANENRTAGRELEKQTTDLITRADLVITETKTLLKSGTTTEKNTEELNDVAISPINLSHQGQKKVQ